MGGGRVLPPPPDPHGSAIESVYLYELGEDADELKNNLHGLCLNTTVILLNDYTVHMIDHVINYITSKYADRLPTFQ